MSATEPPSISRQDRKLSHLSFAPPALETPSRFAARTSVHVSPRSRRGRAVRTLPRTVGIGVAVLAVAVGLASWIAPDRLGALAAQAWHGL